MEANLKNIFRKVFENFKNENKCKELIKDFFKEENDMIQTYKSDPDQNSLLIHLITKIFRLSYQENLTKIFNSSNDEYIQYGSKIMNLIVWMSDEEIIDYSSFLVIVEDILDTFPIKSLEMLFDILENNLKSKSYSNFTDNNRKLTLLKISSTILKRLSSSNDTKFRGRAQMALASIFPISDKSGVNQKGLYNLNNITNQPKFEIEDSRIVNFRFYKQFWIVFKYMANPFLLFSNQPVDENDELKLIDDKLDTTQIICLEDSIQYPKLEIFLNNISKILCYFEQHKIDLNENSDTILSYPKYLTSQNLFELQLNDSSFRKTILTQFLVVLRSFLRPVSQTQKKLFAFSENEKKKLNELLDKIKDILKDTNLYSNLKKIFREEENWENWKESGCPSYEKFPNDQLKTEFSEKMTNKYEDSKYKNIKTKNLFKIDNLSSYDFNKNFEVNLNDLKSIKVNFNYTETLNSENPFLGNYIERVLKDNDPDMGIDEVDSIIYKDETFGWKLLRLVSINDISRLNNESSISSIIKEYADKYGKSDVKFNIKEPTVSISSSNINQSVTTEIMIDEREPSKETYKSDKDKFIKKKRSLDRSEKGGYSEQYKKRKME